MAEESTRRVVRSVSTSASTTEERIRGAPEHWDPVAEHDVLAAVEAKMFSTPQRPVTLSRYVLLRKIGSGAAGVVYSAYDPELDRRVAVKVLRPGASVHLRTLKSRDRFVREARVIAKFSHPNVIAVHDVGTIQGGEGDVMAGASGDRGTADSNPGVFIVMELVEGDNLHGWLHDEPRSWREILRVFLAAGRGLAAAHEAGIVHRDFKPSNVLLGSSADGQVRDTDIKVADFGLAVRRSDAERFESVESKAPVDGTSSLDVIDKDKTDHGPRLTETGTVLGTPAYMAPEQHRGEPADAASDQYAFCVALCRALYGVHPFEGTVWAELYDAKLHERVRIPDKSDVPRWIRRVIERGLSAAPEERYPSIQALLAALEADPARRWRAALGAVALPLGLLGAIWTATVALEPGVVRLDVTAEGHDLTEYGVAVDGEPVRADPSQGLELDAGRHMIEVSAPEHRTARELVEVERGGTHEIDVELLHEQGTINIEVEPPGGTILIDGVDHGSRLANFPIDTGSHDVLVRHVGYYDRRLELDVAEGSSQEHFMALPPALVWSKRRSGAMGEIGWIGDFDGDGFEEVMHRVFTGLSLYDPWTQKILVTLNVGKLPRVATSDFDQDGVPELILMDWDADATKIRVLEGPVRDGRLSTLWKFTYDGPSQESPFSPGDFELGDLNGDGVEDLVLALPAGPRIVALDGRNGRRMFSRPLASAPFAVRLDSTRGRIYALGEKHLQAFTAGGAKLWTTSASPRVSTAGGPVSGSERDFLREPGDRAGRFRTWQRDDGSTDLLLIKRNDDGGIQIELRSGSDGEARWLVEAAEEPARTPVDGNGDGTPDVLVRMRRGEDGSVFALLSGEDGEALWSETYRGQISVVDWNGRPTILKFGGERIHELDPARGDPVVSQTLPESVGGIVKAYDWDGDGREELALRLGPRGLGFVDETLQLVASALLPVRVHGAGTPSDGDLDGFDDLVVELHGPGVVVGPKVRWWRSTSDAIRGAPLVHDVDGDGTLELIVSGEFGGRGGLAVLDAASGRFERMPSGWGMALRGPQRFPRPDGGVDFLINVHGTIDRYRGEDATQVARAKTPHSYTRPAVQDLDGDGWPEVFDVGWEEPAFLYVYDGATFDLKKKVPTSSGGWGQPQLEDFTGDGRLDVAVTQHDGSVILFDAQTWQRHWTVSTGPRLGFAVTPIRRESDGGFDFIVAPSHEQQVVQRRSGRDGSLLWSVGAVGSGRSRPLARDVDGDTRIDVFAVGGPGKVTRLDPEGEVVWQSIFEGLGGKPTGPSSQISLADLDHDGTFEVLSGWEDGVLRVFDAQSGALEWAFHTGGEIEAAPLAADVDGDGLDEVIVASHAGTLYCLNAPRRPR